MTITVVSPAGIIHATVRSAVPGAAGGRTPGCGVSEATNQRIVGRRMGARSTRARVQITTLPPVNHLLRGNILCVDVAEGHQKPFRVG